MILNILIVCAVATEVLPNILKEIQKASILHERIVSGQNVTIEAYPYQLSLQYYTQHYCGAILISSEYAVTAAHCTNQPLTAMRIRAGSSLRSQGGVNVKVTNFTRHPSYNSQNQDNDIAILKLETTLNITEGIKPIQLPQLNEAIPVDSMAVASGWGLLQNGGQLPSQLQAVELPVMSRFWCQGLYPGAIKQSMFCAGYTKGGKDACEGDSGGPLAYNGKLIGIVSWGGGCGKPNQPGVYSNVAYLRQFITTVTGI